MKLSIIIPYYNAEPYTSELLKVLAPQIRDDIEVILVDDGSSTPFKTDYKWCKVIRKKNGGCSTARNRGLDAAVGDYVQFLDADDIVPEYFISKLFKKINEMHPDIIDYSWKSLSAEGAQHNHKLHSDKDWLTNPSVCTRCFKRSFIGDVRFNEKKDSTEDEDFSRKIGYLDHDTNMVHAAITDYMYYYRTAVTNSKIKRFKQGLMHTKRVAYYFNHVTTEMQWLLDEIKREDEHNEVWLLTNRCDITELKRYCQITKPMTIWAHFARGESNRFINIVPVASNSAVEVQVVMYCEFTNLVGGIGTFIYNWCQHMHKDYNILFLYDNIDEFQLIRLRTIVRVMKNDRKTVIRCDTLILNRLTDKIPPNVRYNKVVQMCHCCVQKILRIPANRDYLVNVSQAAKDSWGPESKKGIVIHNMSYQEPKKTLLLVSATRIGAPDKGKNDERYKTLARMLDDARISYVWMNFSQAPLKGASKNIINMGPRSDVQSIIKRADYLVQLSDVEACCYSVLEALTNNTAVICTPVPSHFELGVRDGENAHVIPFNMFFDVHKLLEVPVFEYTYDNEQIREKWLKILEARTPKKEISNFVAVKVRAQYKDIALDRFMTVGEIINMPRERAEYLEGRKLVIILKDP